MDNKDHWTYQEYLNKLSKKVLSFQKGLQRSIYGHDIVSILNASIVADNECAKKLLEINTDELVKIIDGLEKTKKIQAAKKLRVLQCYLEQLKKLSEVNLRELIGLTRDDVAAMQRITCATPVAQGKRRSVLLSTITSLMLDTAEAESIDRELGL